MATFGKATDGTSSSGTSSARKRVSSASPASDGIVQTATIRNWIFGGTGNGNTKAIIYADSGGSPGAILAISDQLNISNTSEQANTYTFSGAQKITVVGGTTYWIGFIQDTLSGSGSLTVSRDSTGNGHKFDANTYASPEDPYGTATNATGIIDCFITYLPIPVLTTDTATATGTTTASATGNVSSDGGSTITERGFVVSTSSNPTISDSKTIVSGTTGAMNGSITGLVTGTTYHIRAYATTVNGTAYGADLSFTTWSVPTVITNAESGIGTVSATGNGDITSIGGVAPTVRGFEYNTVQAADHITIETGSFSTGAFTASLVGLTPGENYYYRAYATNSVGTGYGGWVAFTTVPSTYNVTIDGVDRTTDILVNTLIISDELNDKQNTCNFTLVDRSGNGFPSNDEEIVITLDDGTILFGGYIVGISLSSVKDDGVVMASVECVDYVRLLDRNLVTKAYTDQTDAEIIEDIITTFCPGFGITTTNVIEGVTIDQINFNYIQPSQALRRIADLTGRNWYIDYSKDIHYFPLTTDPAPFNISSSSSAYFDLNISKDASQIKNRVYVRGGSSLSDSTTHEQKGDGVKRQFLLPDKPHDVSVTVNGVSKTLGIKNIDTSGFDYYLNFQEKYVEQDSGAVVLGTGDTLAVTYTYDIPVLVAVEDTASIASNGQKEFAIFDNSIKTQQAARDRASAELTDYANNLIEGSFKTYTTGFVSGQYITINLSAYGINADYIITKVVAISFGAGNYVYEISIASAKTMGIIRFLIELLEANKNLVELNDDEVVDNLLSLTDSLLSDSITDSLTIDSTGPYFTWCPDSLVSTPITRMVWDLFQWG